MRDLQAATERNELELHYQLQVALNDGKVCGAEALMRWRHPTRGVISPAEFIPPAAVEAAARFVREDEPPMAETARAIAAA